jgi:AraC-like DNA-binding protein
MNAAVVVREVVLSELPEYAIPIPQEGDSLSLDALKESAMIYAELGAIEKAADLTEKYIQKSHNAQILQQDALVAHQEKEPFKKLNEAYTPKFDGWSLFYLYAGLIGLFIAVVLNLKREGDRVARVLIGVFLFLHSLFIIHIALFRAKYTFYIPHSLYSSASFSFLYGPLLYFYFKRISSNYKLKVVDILHLLPSLLLIAYLIPIYMYPAEQKLALMYQRETQVGWLDHAIVVLKTVSLITYAYLCYKIYSRNRKMDQTDKKALNWQKNITIFNGVYVVSYIIYGLIITRLVNAEFLVHPQILSMAVLVLYVGYSAYINPNILVGGEKKLVPIKKYKKSGLAESLSQELADRIHYIFDKEEYYRHNDISLENLSSKLECSRHHTSQVINAHFQCSFFELVNRYRINEAKDQMALDVYRNLTIIEIAYGVGFNNKVTFNKAFKKDTGLTPSQYIEAITHNSGKLEVNTLRQG